MSTTKSGTGQNNTGSVTLKQLIKLTLPHKLLDCPTFLVPLIIGCSCIPLLKGLNWSASLPLNLAFRTIARIQALSIFESHATHWALRAFGCVASTQRLGLTGRRLRLAAGTSLFSLIGQFGVHLGGAGRRHHGWWAHHGLLLGFRTARGKRREIRPSETIFRYHVFRWL